MDKMLNIVPIVGEQVLLRLYLPSADRAPRMPTHERVLKAARAEGMAGATTLRGILGIGEHGALRPTAWSIVRNTPIILEIVDSGDRIAQFATRFLAPLMPGRMMTLERAAVARYRARNSPADAGITLAAALRPLSTVPNLDRGLDMAINENGILLRIFIGESDRQEGKPLYEAIVQKVRALGLAGATVLRGAEGFGANSVVHRAGLMEMSPDLPIVIEIVDSQEKIDRLLPHLDVMVKEGMITMEHVMIVIYRHSQSASVPLPHVGPDDVA